jgi:hypothetical protein
MTMDSAEAINIDSALYDFERACYAHANQDPGATYAKVTEARRRVEDAASVGRRSPPVRPVNEIDLPPYVLDYVKQFRGICQRDYDRGGGVDVRDRVQDALLNAIRRAIHDEIYGVISSEVCETCGRSKDDPDGWIDDEGKGHVCGEDHRVSWFLTKPRCETCGSTDPNLLKTRCADNSRLGHPLNTFHASSPGLCPECRGARDEPQMFDLSMGRRFEGRCRNPFHAANRCLFHSRAWRVRCELPKGHEGRCCNGGDEFASGWDPAVNADPLAAPEA